MTYCHEVETNINNWKLTRNVISLLLSVFGYDELMSPCIQNDDENMFSFIAKHDKIIICLIIPNKG